MSKILVAGASGALGYELVKLLHDEEREFCGQIRNPVKHAALEPYCQDIRVADVTDPSTLRRLCEGVDTIISTVGNSVSLFTNDTGGFMDIDYQGNLNLLQEAKNAGVKRFVYISIFASETSPRMRQGWAQELFSRRLMESGLSYTIVKPVGLFSGLHDLLILGRKGIVPTLGSGKAVTNPIHQRDLARVILPVVDTGPEVMEVGGPEVHSRREVSEWVMDITGGRDIRVPPWLARRGAHLWRPLKRSIFDKFRFYTYITTHDMVAPKHGSLLLRPYLEQAYLQMTSR
ncbi:SDR family oxidoreductase [Roseivirga sp. BDSF3-8]|uniref:SDR family oxidoreductase n=1 Tax=Roseivirga sp. BDSF3-8 TaxID=3241598 RepID=UPI003531BF85